MLQVLKKRDEENTITKSQQKRKITRFVFHWFTFHLLGSQRPTPNVLAQGWWTACQGEVQWDLGPGAAMVAVMAWGRNPEQTGK